jgi:carboxylesterase
MTAHRIIPTAEPYFWPGGPTGCLLIQGYTVLGIRLSGHATGIEDMMRTRHQDWLASAEDGWHLLQGHTERVFAIGLSLGGVLSLLLASKFPVAGVVTMASFYDIPSKLAKRLGPLIIPLSKVYPKKKKKGGGWFIPERERDYVAYKFNPVRPAWELTLLLRQLRETLPHIQTPTLIIHSKDEDYVLPEQAEMLFKHLGSEDKELLWVEGAGHIITRDGDPTKMFQAIAAFVERLSG